VPLLDVLQQFAGLFLLAEPASGHGLEQPGVYVPALPLGVDRLREYLSGIGVTAGPKEGGAVPVQGVGVALAFEVGGGAGDQDTSTLGIAGPLQGSGEEWGAQSGVLFPLQVADQFGGEPAAGGLVPGGGVGQQGRDEQAPGRLGLLGGTLEDAGCSGPVPSLRRLFPPGGRSRVEGDQADMRVQEEGV
jgi:hypothetical protein